MSGEPSNVLVDAQFGIGQVLKPFPGFENVYQAKAGTIPIAFPGVVDELARQGVTGYDPNLIAGIPVGLGSRVVLWIPQTIAGYTTTMNYQYRVLWRMRNVQSYRDRLARGIQEGNNYHLVGNVQGEPQTQTPNQDPSQKRYLIPGAQRVLAFEPSEPVSGTAVTNLRPEAVRPFINQSWVRPLTPAGQPGVWQQGTYLFSSEQNPGGPSWSPFWFDAEGDELAILCEKVDPTNPWDFTDAAADKSFSNTFGTNAGTQPINPNVGIYVFTGAGTP